MRAMSEPNEMTCEQFADVAAEMALGVLTGRERAQAIAHLDRCDSCREHVLQLTTTGEELIGLLPASEPPAGFETRVLERLGHAAPSAGKGGRIRRTVRHPIFNVNLRPRLALAAAVLAVVAVAGGWGLRDATAPAPAPALTSATLLSASHQAAGEVFVYGGSRPWLYMSVDIGSGDGTVICQVESANGQVTTIGTFRLDHGYGYWGSPTRVSSTELTGARLVSSTGTVLATASL
jgi:hypothetical protein